MDPEDKAEAPQQLLIRVEPSIAEVEADDWDACANPTGIQVDSEEDTYNPFISHAFLSALEESGCVQAEAGWMPQHLVLEGPEGGIDAVMPAYLKGHSQGEYVFDHGWADAFERAGGDYYPKLQVSVPFSPVTGRRLLVGPGMDLDIGRRALIGGAQQLCQRYDASSVHWTFLTRPEWDAFGELGLLQRTDQQFHWHNPGYEDFGAFLTALSSRKRKAIRRERRQALEEGIEVEWLRGSDITEAHWDLFFGYYVDTGSRKWGTPYLNRDFFSLLGERLGERVLLILASSHGQPVAGALNLLGDTTVYGRHWGCSEYLPFLHFELCYYQAMDFAIEHGFSVVEAGAQGPHKLARGYLPVTTRSAHYIANPGLRRAIADYLSRERLYVAQENRVMEEHSPFRKDE